MQIPVLPTTQRILVIVATFPPTRCGVGDYARRLTMEIAGGGHDVFVLTAAGEDPEHQHGADDGGVEIGAPGPARQVAAPVFTELAPRLHVARAVGSWDWSSLDMVRASLQAVRPDVVNLQYHGEDYLLHPAVCVIPELAARQAIPTAVTLHNLQHPHPWNGQDDPFSAMLSACEVWICTNTFDESKLRERLRPSPTPRLHKITAGPGITADHDRNPSVDGPFEVAYFGFLNPQKGLEYLLRSAALLRAQGRDLRLDLAAGLHTDAPGRLCDYAAFIEQEIGRLRLRECVRWRGYLPQTEVSRMLAHCHLGVFPFRDGLSGKNSSFWSVLHHATPALTTHGEGLPDGLVDGHNILLARAQDASDLAQRIAWAMDHRAELPAMGERGRQYVLERLDWPHLAQRMVETFGIGVARAGRVAGA